jgi:hypothetical protein
VIPAPPGGYDPSCPALSSPCREAGATKTCLRVAQSGVRYAMEISCRPQRESGSLAWLGVVRGCLDETTGAPRPRPTPAPTPPACELGQVIPAPAGGYDPSCPALSSPCREAGATKTCLRVAQSGVRYAMEISCRPQRESGSLAWLGVVRGCLEGDGARVE